MSFGTPQGADLHHEQDVEAAQRDGVEGEEVSGQQPSGLSAQEGPPPGVATPWCWAESGGGQDPPDGACAYAVPESDEFSLDPAPRSCGAAPSATSTGAQPNQ
jgi:hypothetical protein